MSDLDDQKGLLYEAIQNNTPGKLIEEDYKIILQDEKDDAYITMFLQAIIPKVVDETTRAWALPIFELLLKKAYNEHVYLNHIDLVDYPTLNGDIIFLNFNIEQAKTILKTYPSILYDSSQEFDPKINSVDLLKMKLNAILEFNLIVSKEIMIYVITYLSENPDLLPLLQKCIEHVHKNGLVEYIEDELIHQLPLPLLEPLLQNNAILLNEQNKILQGENIEEILRLLKDKARKLNFLFLNKKHYGYQDEHHNNLLLLAVANKHLYAVIIQLLKIIPHDICNREGKNFLTLAYENGCDYFQDLLKNIADNAIDIDFFNLKDAHGNHVLSFISMCDHFIGDIDLYKSLFNVPNYEGNTPFMLSLISRNIISTKLLDDASIDVRIKNNLGQTALIIAVLNNIKEDIQQKIISAYASSELPSDTISTAFDDVDHIGNTALMTSVLVKCKPWFDALYKTSANKTLFNLEGKSIYDDEYASFVNIPDTDENLLWKNITLYKKEANEGLYTLIDNLYKKLSPDVQLKFKYYLDEIPPLSPPVIMRTNSDFHTDQGVQGTCYAHAFTRLMVQNIFKIKTDKRDIKDPICIQMLMTDPKEIKKDNDDLFSAEKCGPEVFLKIGLFLFIYYHIITNYGIDGISPIKYYSMCNDLILFFNNIKYKFTKEEEIFSPPFLNRFKKGHVIYKTILDFLKGFTLPEVSCTTVELFDNLTAKENTSFALLIRYYIQNQLYVGLSYISKSTSAGHIFLITGINEIKKTFQIKNSWLEIESEILWKDIDKTSKHYVFEGNERTDLMFNRLVFLHPGQKIKDHIIETCNISSSSRQMENLFKQTMSDLQIPPDKKVYNPFGGTKKYKTYRKKTRKFKRV
jgi:ankyrin repeat protein